MSKHVLAGERNDSLLTGKTSSRTLVCMSGHLPNLLGVCSCLVRSAVGPSSLYVCSHRDHRTKSTFQHSSLSLHQQALLLCSVRFTPPFFLCFVLVILPN
ncbi:hypothetical protein ATANTOWER_012449 [Ataeniobius toweri]|uniref:Uncharacterized protein n=1 Tax=Ataeniobius toweri TaxID=208326 RepID=A0ABU7A7B0_9TELE|nr:hypothetical protein [Ataeniobius toweri]